MLIVLLAIGASICCSRGLDRAVFVGPRRPSRLRANAFALLGLRALFFLVKGLLDRLVYLSTGLALILAFIGAKLILHWAHEDISTAVPEISTPVSLGVILVVLVVVTVASLINTRGHPELTAHAGSITGHKAVEPKPKEQ